MKKISFIIALVFSLAGYTQQDFLIYGLHDIPQSSYSNPSNRFNGNFFIGLPAISSNYLNLSNSGFAYSDLVKKDGDSLQLDFESLLKELDDENYLSFNSKVDLLSFGISIGNRSQFILSITENASFRFSYPKDFIQLIYKGNTGFNDNTANFNGIGFNMTHYREYGLSFSHQLNEKLRLGLKAKYLYGMENIYSEKTDISLTTDPNTYELTARADITLRTSGIDDDYNKAIKDESEADYAFSRNNVGYGVDLGAYYEYSDELSFNASILDLGQISWNSYTKTHANNGGEFSFDGIEFSAYGDDTDTSSTFDHVIDSLEEAFELKESTGKYSTPLPTRFYIGANYKLTEQDLFGGLIQSEYFQGSLRPAFSVNYARKMNKWITLATSYTIINKSYNNLGFGFNLQPGPVQFYVVSDNLLGVFRPQHTKHLQVRFGINLVFGTDKSKEIRAPYRGVIKQEEEQPEAEGEVEDKMPDVIIPEEEGQEQLEESNEQEDQNEVITPEGDESGIQEEESNQEYPDSSENNSLDEEGDDTNSEEENNQEINPTEEQKESLEPGQGESDEQETQQESADPKGEESNEEINPSKDESIEQSEEPNEEDDQQKIVTPEGTEEDNGNMAPKEEIKKNDESESELEKHHTEDKGIEDSDNEKEKTNQDNENQEEESEEEPEIK